jgi:acyl dehydratase
MIVDGITMGVNYGLNKLRFPAPVPVGCRVRMHMQLKEVTDVTDGVVQVTSVLTFEVEGQEKPACVAESIARFYF